MRDLAKQQRGLTAMTAGRLAARQALATELALHAATLMGAQGGSPDRRGSGRVNVRRGSGAGHLTLCDRSGRTWTTGISSSSEAGESLTGA
jgi:hypothetical protein